MATTQQKKRTYKFYGRVHLDGFVVVCNQVATQNEVIRDFFQGSLPAGVRVDQVRRTKRWAFICHAPLVKTGQDFKKPLLQYIANERRSFVSGHLRGRLASDRFLNPHRQARLDEKKAIKEAIRVAVARASCTATGHTAGELADLGDGVYETATHFVTVSRGFVITGKKGRIEKDIRWFLVRGVSLLDAERLNNEDLKIANFGCIAGMTSNFGPIGTKIVLESDLARKTQLKLEAIKKRPATTIIRPLKPGKTARCART